MPGFVHLHVHSHYSLLQSMVKIPDLIAKTKELGLGAVALTDHGNMFGAVDFYLAAKSQDVKPILGCEIYYTAGSRHTKPDAKAMKAARKVGAAENADANRLFRLVLLCKDAVGYQSLCELVSRSYTEGFFEDMPRADYELLQKHSKGLVALTSGLKGEVGYHIAKGSNSSAEDVAKKLREIYGSNLFLEVQENGLPDQAKLNAWSLEFGQKEGIGLVATADVHYLRREQAPAQEVLQCIGAGYHLDETRAARICPDEYYYKDEQTMRSQFAWHEEAVNNTVLIANQCHFSFKLKDEKGRQIYHLPDFKSETPETPEQALRRLSELGLEQRLSRIQEDHAPYHKRLIEELDMICKTGFAGYFLVVADFIRFAKEKKIPVGPGRGSGAGSLVAYSLRITDIDPIPFNLLFERFINPERVSMPDFDIDFCQDRRGEVIQYVVQKYGRENVSQIITFGKLLARGVVRDTGRVLGLSYAEVDLIAKLIPEELGITLEGAFEKEPKLREVTDRDPKLNRLFETARILEGSNRHASVHAAGVVITNRPLVEYCPLSSTKEGETVVQYDKDYAEKIGLVKFDFLGLKTLTVIDNAVKFVVESKREVVLDEINYKDPKVYQLISNGDTDGIFQLESSGMKDLCMRVQPGNLEDITAINALYRPGPLNSGMVDDFINRKHGRTEIRYELPQLKDILEETYGVIVYQEQVMRVARVLANYSLGEADILRRAMGKKKPEEMAKQRDKFVSGCTANSIDADKANKLFDLLAKFAEYGFNKSHSAAYGVLSYQTAFLKTYYTAQFMAALMATEMDNTDKMAQYISDSKKHGIEILPPDVNASRKNFSVTRMPDGSEAIRFGLEAIKGVGGVAVDVILAERELKGPFQSFLDFCKRVSLRKVNKKVLECLISVGGFDSIEKETRATLMESLEAVMEYASDQQEQADLGQVSIFDDFQSQGLKVDTDIAHLVRRVPDWPESKKLQIERQLVGFYISGHPMEKWATVAKGFTHGDLTWLKAEWENKKGKPGKWEVTLAVMVNSSKEIVTKKGSKMAFVDFEDQRATIESVVFPEAYEASAETIRRSAAECMPIVVSGHISLEEEAPKLFVRTMEFVEEYQRRRVQTVIFNLRPETVTPPLLAQLRAALVRHPGRCNTFIEYRGKVGTVESLEYRSRLSLPKELAVNPSAELMNEVNRLFGEEVVRFG